MELYDETVLASQIIYDEKNVDGKKVTRYASATNNIVTMSTFNYSGTIHNTIISIYDNYYPRSPSEVLTSLFKKYNPENTYSFEISLPDEETFSFSTNKTNNNYFMSSSDNLIYCSPEMHDFAKEVLDRLNVPYSTTAGIPTIGTELTVKELTPEDVSSAADFIVEKYNHAKMKISTNDDSNPFYINFEHYYLDTSDRHHTVIQTGVSTKDNMKKIETETVNEIVADLVELGIDFSGEWDLFGG